MSLLSRAHRALPSAIGLALVSAGAHAASITVTNGGDNGTASTCTLRQALLSATNDAAGTSSCVAGSGADTIGFATSLQNSTISLVSGELQVGNDVSVYGSGQTINAHGASRVMYINAGGTIQISNLKLVNGHTTDEGGGGGILIAASALPPATTLAHNAGKRHASVPNVSASATVLLANVTVSGNSATGSAGGIASYGAYLALKYSTVSGNSVVTSGSYAAGGVLSVNGLLAVANSTISGNTVTGDPQASKYLIAGAYAYNSQSIFVDSTISGNTASGSNDIVGGAGFGGGDPQSTTKYAELVSNTISGNTAIGTGPVVVGGVFANQTVAIGNTILSANTGPTADFLDAVPTIQMQSNLLGTALQSTFTGNGNVFSDNPGLGPLANNGGPTRTRALIAGSPAINAGDSTLVSGLMIDQRGAGFPRIVGPAIDIGAFEGQVAAAVVNAIPAPALSTWAATALAGLLATSAAIAGRLRHPRTRKRR
ncbi:MAG TPA: choice-of-anchor Q domain-containing protein [Rudaea sp.]